MRRVLAFNCLETTANLLQELSAGKNPRDQQDRMDDRR